MFTKSTIKIAWLALNTVGIFAVGSDGPGNGTPGPLPVIY